MIRLLTNVVLILVFFSLSSGNIIKVPQDKPTIQAGIDSAFAGDTVLVSENTYYENIFFKGKAITVASEFITDGDTSHISRTIIDGSQSSNPDSASVVYFISGEDTTSVLCGFTITGGKGNYFGDWDAFGGAGIYIDYGGKILNNIIHSNSINSEILIMGGGISARPISDFNIIIENNIIRSNSIVTSSNNRGAYGAGVNITFYRGGKYCRINKNIISNNSTTHTRYDGQAMGGGIYIDLPAQTFKEIFIYNNLITYNEVHSGYSSGAGIHIYHYAPVKEIYDYHPCPHIYNNIIAHNFSEEYGGGISIVSIQNEFSGYSIIRPQPAVINNTIVNNASKDGCGIFNLNSYPLLLNNIIWNDLSQTGSSEIFNESIKDHVVWPDRNNIGSISIYSSLIQDIDWLSINSGCFYLNPKFIDESYQLSEASPAIGLGKKAINMYADKYEAPIRDFNGNSRPNDIDTLVDIGAYETSHQPALRVYPTSFNIDKLYISADSDSIQFRTKLHNPDFHILNVFGRITSIDSAVVDSVQLFDDGNHDDGQISDGLYGGCYLTPVMIENEFNFGLGVDDNDIGKYNIFNDDIRATSIGPIVFEGYNIEYHYGNLIGINLSLRNEGHTGSATGIIVELFASDTNVVTQITSGIKRPIDISAGQTVKTQQTFNIRTAGSPDTLYFYVKIYSNGYHYWSDSSGMATSLAQKNQILPTTLSLSQNYPNPFNSTTIINYELPARSENRPITNHVELAIYNLLGQKVAILVSEKQSPGRYNVEWDASSVASGVYYYRLKAGPFIDTKKLIYIK